MTQNQRLAISELVNAEIERLGSGEKAATRCGVSGATISLIKNAKWDQVTESMWLKIGNALGHRPTGWHHVPTTNSRIVESVCGDAQRNSMFFAISHRAGSGKTASLERFARENRSTTFLIQAREWAKRDFLLQLCRVLGIDTTYRMTLDDLVQEVIHFFQSKPGSLLAIDEADKLKSPAMRTLIPIYNACEGVLGVVIAGTDHLEKEMRNDVRLSRKGSDEIISRFGRKFIHLHGANLADVAAICRANGITDKAQITAIFKEAEPVTRLIDLGESKTRVDVVDDLRRVKRIIQRTTLKLEESVAAEAA